MPDDVGAAATAEGGASVPVWSVRCPGEACWRCGAPARSHRVVLSQGVLQGVAGGEVPPLTGDAALESAAAARRRVPLQASGQGGV